MVNSTRITRQISTSLALGAAIVLAWLPFGASAHGSFHDLMQSIDQQIAQKPADASLFLRKADIYLEHGEWQPCLIEVERVERLAPGEFATDLTRGRALAMAGRWELSKLSLDSFLESHVDHPFGLLERARAHNALKHDDACLADYRQALKKTPNPEPDLFQEVAEALWLRSKQEEAVSVLNQGLKILGNAPQLVIKAMEYELAVHRYDAALTRVDAMQHAMPRPEPWMARRASILAQAGRVPESLTAWTALVNHLKALPNLERGSNAMCLLMEQAQTAIAALSRVSQSSSQPLPSRP